MSYNQVSDPSLPPFSKPLTWTDIDQRISATSFYKTRLTHLKDNSRYHSNLAPLLGEIGDCRSELKHHRLAVHYNPQSANCRNDYALALYKEKRLKEAEEQFNIVLSLQPDHIIAINNLSACLCKQGKLQQASKLLTDALTAFPMHAMTLRNLAKIKDTLGDTRSSIQYNTLAINNGPGRHGVTDHGDTMAYRNIARQICSRGVNKEGVGGASSYYDQYRYLAGKVKVLDNSEKTKELIERTRSKR